MGKIYRHTQQGDLRSVLTKIKGGYTERRTDRTFISYASFYLFIFSNKESGLKMAAI
jgi:hypothetical protein